MKSLQFPQPGSWRYVGGIWLGIALFDASQTVFVMRAEGMHHAWVILFFVRALSWLVWALATPWVAALMQRFPLPTKTFLPWCVHAIACLAIGILSASWSAGLESIFDPWLTQPAPASFAAIWRGIFFGSLLGDAILYGGILAFHTVFSTRERLARQQADAATLNELLAQSQLAALRLQLEPHFMFNALNAITGLIREGRGNDAISMIALMGDLLRRVTDRSERQFVRLEEEAAFLRKYLDIQGLRFADRLRYCIDIPEQLKAAQIPDMILQPLVENAIRHGISARAKGGEVRIAATRAGAVLMLSVYNDGPELCKDYQSGAGIGVRNASQRLATLYGNAAALNLQNHAATGVLASISLPYSVGGE